MVDALEEVQFKPGETIIKEDEDGRYFYMIVEGDVSVCFPGMMNASARCLSLRSARIRACMRARTNTGVTFARVQVTKNGQEGELARRSRSDYFGELSLRTGSKTMATVTATGEKPCKVY